MSTGPAMATTWASCRRAVDDEGRVHDVENVLDRRRKGSGVAGCWTRQPPQLKCNIRDSARPRIWPAKNCTIAAGLGSRRPRADGRARAIQVTGLRQAEPGRIPCSSRREAVCPPAAAWRAATVEFRFVSLHLILDCLNRERTRCTYGAVAAVIGSAARGVGQRLEAKDPRNSWMVNKDTGEPTGYLDSQKHPDLHRTPHIITTEKELRELLKRRASDR